MRAADRHRRRRGHSRSMTSIGDNGGFTLMELLLVLGLLVTAMSMVVPALARYQRAMPLNQAVSMFRTELLRTRLLAIDEAETWMVELSPDGRSFSRYRNFEKDASVRTTFRLPEGVILLSASRIHSEQSIKPLQFLPDGTVTSATLVLKDSEGLRRTLILDRLTGAIRPATDP